MRVSFKACAEGRPGIPRNPGMGAGAGPAGGAGRSADRALRRRSPRSHCPPARAAGLAPRPRPPSRHRTRHSGRWGWEVACPTPGTVPGDELLRPVQKNSNVGSTTVFSKWHLSVYYQITFQSFDSSELSLPCPTGHPPPESRHWAMRNLCPVGVGRQAAGSALPSSWERDSPRHPSQELSP